MCLGNTKKDIRLGYPFSISYERETSHEVRGTSALRGPEWNGEDRNARHGCASVTQKKDIRFGYPFCVT